MSYKARAIGYLLVLVVLLTTAILAPNAWATPAQTRPGQTVPTPTPKSTRSPTVEPTAGPPPQPTAVLETPSAAASSTPTQPPPSATLTDGDPRQGTGSLLLTKEVNRRQVWPGAILEYTLILTNTGSSSVRQVVLTDPFPAGLEPGKVLEGPATWDGRTLRAETLVLPPGGRLTVIFSATIEPSVPPGGVLVNRATVIAAGGISVTASTTIILPPSELPPTGGLQKAECRF
jgi:uncharacterized repeat protein (TIGR01451 family)